MPEGSRRIELPRQSRAAAFGTVNVDKRTVELVWSTGAAVTRFDWWSGKEYIEELSLDPAHVRLGRLNSGAPLMGDHRIYELSQVFGVVERAWIENGEGRAVVRFSEDPDAERVFAKVREGVIRNVSITYEVYKYEITKEDGKPERWLAVDWEPWEISLVPVGADAGAGTRAAPHGQRNPCELVTRADAAHKEESDMEKTASAGPQPATGDELTRAQPANPAAPAPQPAQPPQVDEAAIRADERKRAGEIRSAARAALRAIGVASEDIETFADGLIERGVDLNAARAQILDEVARRAGQAAQPRITGGYDARDPANIRSAIANAIAARATRNMPQGARIEPTEQARAYMGMTVLDALAEYARAAGQKLPAHLPRAALYDHLVSMRALSTSDFPLILADASHKVMVASYNLANTTYRLIFARKTFTDFKPHYFLRAGDFPQLLEKEETGEFKYGSMSEARNPVVLGTWGRIIGISRRVLVNDEMQVFADLPVKAGRRVADFENGLAWAQLALNGGGGPTIYEKNLPAGRPLFHSDHGNLASQGTDIDVANVGSGRGAMMKQTSLDGLKLNIMPRYLVTGPDMYTKAEQFCATAILPTKDAEANPFKGRLTPVGEANLTGNAWYLFADPADIETLVYGYLEGAEGPQIAVREGFTTDGTEMRVYVDFAVGAVDFRGAYKNAGPTPQQ